MWSVGEGCSLLTTPVLHWKWHTDAFKLMWLPSTFRFFYISLLLYPSGFLIFTGPFFSSASVHPGDRCTIGALRLRNVYIIHITPQKVLIKLYMANGVGSHRLKVLPISQMSQWIDRERRVCYWGFDLKMALI